MPFTIWRTGGINFYLSIKTTLNHDFKTSPVFSAPSFHLFLSHHILSIVFTLLIYFFFLLYNLFSHQHSTSSPTLSLKFLVFWKVLDHYVTDVLLVRAKTETGKQGSKNTVDFKIHWLTAREVQPVTVVPLKSSYNNVNAVIYPTCYKVVQAASMQMSSSYVESFGAETVAETLQRVRPLFCG